MRNFVEGQFALRDLTAYPELDGLRFFELDPRFQRHIMNRTLRCITIMKDTHPQVKFDVFERLNTGAVKLSPQEIRHGIYFGPLMKLVESLAHNKDFTSLLPGSPERRMKAEEYVLRFFSLYYDRDKYEKPLSNFLNTFSESNRNIDQIKQDDFEKLFSRTVRNVHVLFGELAFKTFDHQFRVTSSFNAALLDAEMVAAGGIDVPPSFGKTEREKLLTGLADLLASEEFSRSIARATSDEPAIKHRIKIMSDFLHAQI